MGKSTVPWDKPDPNKKPHHLTGVQKTRAKTWAKNHNMPYPSLVAKKKK